MELVRSLNLREKDVNGAIFYSRYILSFEYKLILYPSIHN